MWDSAVTSTLRVLRICVGVSRDVTVLEGWRAGGLEPVYIGHSIEVSE
jgi:hypothetical protein